MFRIIVSFLMVSISACASTENISVEPSGEFAEIDVEDDQRAIERLMREEGSAIAAVLKEPDGYSPPVLYALSHALFENEREEEAMFWFYLGQLRARSDANKSLDPSARQAVSVLNQQFGTNINQFAFQDIELLKQTVFKVLEWDEAHERQYDPRWIALHGMGAFTQSEIAFEPPQKWREIDVQTRNDYLSGFTSALKQISE
ncbi:MAG: hypothetical protein AAF270_16325 [Pseudomonadota bacterium]